MVVLTAVVTNLLIKKYQRKNCESSFGSKKIRTFQFLIKRNEFFEGLEEYRKLPTNKE